MSSSPPSPALPPLHGSAPSYSSELTVAQATQMIEEFRATEINVKINAFAHLQQIATILGTKRTRDELIPYLTEFCDDDDEVLVVISEQLGNMLTTVGGAEYIANLLPPLEQLAGTEETAVREKAVASLTKLCSSLSDSLIQSHLLPLLRRVSTAEWFTSRVAACALLPTVYPHVDDAAKTELRALFTALCKKDETPMVKRAATSSIGLLAQVIDPKIITSFLYDLLKKLSKDEQDSVRLLIIPTCITIANVFLKENMKGENVTKIKPILLSMLEDTSWRVRYILAEKYCELCTALHPSVSEDLIMGFMLLLKDPETEVRTAAASGVGGFAKLLGEKLTLDKLFNVPSRSAPKPWEAAAPLQAIVDDNSPANAHVKAALASVIMSLTNILSPPHVIQSLLPLFLKLLHDENSEVRLNFIAQFDSNITNIIKQQDILTTSLLPAITDLSQDNKWRVRLQIIQLIPTLAKQLGQDFFDSKLSSLCFSLLGDPVWSIREAAIANLSKLTALFGTAWATQAIVPKVQTLAQDKSYLYRITAVFAIQELAPVFGAAFPNQFLQLLSTLSSDPVANIRFNCFRLLGELLASGSIPSSQSAGISSLLSTAQKQDVDPDCRYFAQKSMERIEQIKI